MQRLLTALALTAGTALPLAAQAKVEINPTVGLYLPAGNIVDQYGAGCSCQVRFNQQQGFLFGVRVTIWASPNLGLETSAATIGSGVHGVASGVASGDTSGTVNIVSERLVWRFAHLNAMSSVYLAGGLAYIIHDSPAYDGLSGTKELGGGAGLGLRLGLGSSTTFKAEIEDYIYTAQFEAQGQQTEAKHQNDIVISVGLAIGI